MVNKDYINFCFFMEYMEKEYKIIPGQTTGIFISDWGGYIREERDESILHGKGKYCYDYKIVEQKKYQRKSVIHLIKHQITQKQLTNQTLKLSI